jgi:uncharacterized protein YigE (DUF2233 family)
LVEDEEEVVWYFHGSEGVLERGNLKLGVPPNGVFFLGGNTTVILKTDRS